MSKNLNDEFLKQYKVQAIVRELDPVPSWLSPGCHWCVELWGGNRRHPVAQAWVCVMPLTAHIDWLHVQESYRRIGLATVLVEVVKRVWPHVEYEAGTYAGMKFLRASS